MSAKRGISEGEALEQCTPIGMQGPHLDVSSLRKNWHGATPARPAKDRRHSFQTHFLCESHAEQGQLTDEKRPCRVNWPSQADRQSSFSR